jgi:hypothetical protein
MRARLYVNLRRCGQEFARGEAYRVIVPQPGKLRAVGFMSLAVPIYDITGIRQ